MAFVIHELDHARAALAAAEERGVAVELWSVPGAAAYGGAGWFQALVRHAAAERPRARFAAVLDCAGRADLAQAAWRQGLSRVCFTGPPLVAAKLADIARHYGATVHRRRPRALDLAAERDADAACRRWLGGD